MRELLDGADDPARRMGRRLRTIENAEGAFANASTQAASMSIERPLALPAHELVDPGYAARGLGGIRVP